MSSRCLSPHHGIPVFWLSILCIMIQSMIRRNRNGDSEQPCLVSSCIKFGEAFEKRMDRKSPFAILGRLPILPYKPCYPFGPQILTHAAYRRSSCKKKRSPIHAAVAKTFTALTDRGAEGSDLCRLNRNLLIANGLR